MADVDEIAQELLRGREAAKIIGKSVSWLAHNRSQGRGPRYMRIGAGIRYRRADLDSYLSGSTVETEDTRRQAVREGKAA